MVDVGDDGDVADVVARGHIAAYSRSGEDGLRVRLCYAGPAGLNMPRPHPMVRGRAGRGSPGHDRDARERLPRPYADGPGGAPVPFLTKPMSS
ncbi:hypothetical protein GCM10010129_21580 [Streptomyces fumigatiscleroticus]|nr:hypothetical protein GCM10010129_21580 [Streptomyces fumigatiscleroticus]